MIVFLIVAFPMLVLGISAVVLLTYAFHTGVLYVINVTDGTLLWAALGAIGTIGSTVTALFFGLWRLLGWFEQKPNLKAIPIESGPPDCVKIPTKRTIAVAGKTKAEADAYYARMRIRNVGKKVAKQVEIYASKLRRLEDETSFEVAEFLPANLRWVGPPTGLKDISPGMERSCVIAVVFDPNRRHKFPPQQADLKGFDPKSTILSIHAFPKSNQKGYLQRPGTYILDVEIGAANVEPESHRIKIHLDENWEETSEKMFGEGHFSVQLL